MYQPIDERFYQATKYQDWNEKTKVMTNRLFTTMKNFCT